MIEHKPHRRLYQGVGALEPRHDVGIFADGDAKFAVQHRRYHGKRAPGEIIGGDAAREQHHYPPTQAEPRRFGHPSPLGNAKCP